MGVGIAVPIAKYDIIDVDVCTIGTTLPLPKKETPGTLVSLYEKCFGPSSPECSWEVASKRSNRMVSVVLQPRNGASRRGLRSASKKKVKHDTEAVQHSVFYIALSSHSYIYKHSHPVLSLIVIVFSYFFLFLLHMS